MSKKEYFFIFFLPQGEWEVNTRQRMICALAEKLKGRGRILCVERPVCLTLTPFVWPGRFLSWLYKRNKLRKMSDNLFIYTPWNIVHDRALLGAPFLARLNNIIQACRIKRILRTICDSNMIKLLWIYHPYQKNYCNIIEKDILIYEIYDEYHEFEYLNNNQLEKNNIIRNENFILKKADIVLTTSMPIYDRIANARKNVFYIPNGADAEHFKLKNVPEPYDVRSISKPRIGYVGKINERIDYPLVNYIARRHPEWSFIFIGCFDGQNSLKRDRNFIEFSSMKNVFMTGWKDYINLPSYLHCFDVCIIPFVINTLTKSIYPLKLHEYLAAGKPVVSTDLPEVRQFDNIMYIGRDKDEFENAIAAALTENDKALISARIKTAEENSWAKRSEDVISVISRHS